MLFNRVVNFSIKYTQAIETRTYIAFEQAPPTMFSVIEWYILNNYLQIAVNKPTVSRSLPLDGFITRFLFELIYFAPFSKQGCPLKQIYFWRWDQNCHADINKVNSLQASDLIKYSRKQEGSKGQEAMYKLTFSSLPLFCWSFFSRPRTAFPLSLGFREDGRWGPLTAALIRLLWPLQSLYWADWRFLGPGEGLISCNTCKKPQYKATSEH